MTNELHLSLADFCVCLTLCFHPSLPSLALSRLWANILMAFLSMVRAHLNRTLYFWVQFFMAQKRSSSKIFKRKLHFFGRDAVITHTINHLFKLNVKCERLIILPSELSLFYDVQNHSKGERRGVQEDMKNEFSRLACFFCV